MMGCSFFGWWGNGHYDSRVRHPDWGSVEHLLSSRKNGELQMPKLTWLVFVKMESKPWLRDLGSTSTTPLTSLCPWIRRFTISISATWLWISSIFRWQKFEEMYRNSNFDHWKLLSTRGFLQTRSMIAIKSVRIVQYLASDAVQWQEDKYATTATTVHPPKLQKFKKHLKQNLKTYLSVPGLIEISYTAKTGRWSELRNVLTLWYRRFIVEPGSLHLCKIRSWK